MKYSLKAIISIAICFLCLSSCKKSDNNNDDLPTVDETTTLSMQSGLPGQIVELTTATTLSSELYVLQVGAEAVSAVRTSGNTLVFMLPYIPSGDYFIDLRPVSPALGQVSIKISQYTPVGNVQDAYNEVFAQMTQDNPGNPETSDLIKQRFEEEFANLSEEQKKAQLLQIRNLLQQIEDERTALMSYASGRDFVRSGQISAGVLRASGGIAASIKEDAAEYVAAIVTSAIVVGATAIAVTAGGPLAGVAVGIVAVWKLTSILATVERKVEGIMGKSTAALFDEITYGNYRNSGRVRTPVSSRASAPKANAPVNSGLAFTKGEAEELDITYTFGSIALELEQHVEGGFFGNLFSAYHKMMSIYTPLYNGQQKIKQLLKTDKEVLPSPSSFIPSEFVKETRSATAQQVRIENVSPAGLSISMEQGQNGILFTANSSTITEKVDFSFELVYTEPEYGTVLRRTYSGTYDGSEEDKDGIVGVWVLKHEKKSWRGGDGTLYQSESNYAQDSQISTYTFRSDNTGTIQLWNNSSQSYSTANFLHSFSGAVNEGQLYQLTLINSSDNRENGYNFTINGNILKLFSYEHFGGPGEAYNYETTLERQ